MTVAQAKKFIDAITTAGIKQYEMITDISNHFYNNANAVIKLDETNGVVWNICASPTTGSAGKLGRRIVFNSSATEDIHEAKTWCNYEEAVKFINAIGLSLTDDEMKIVVSIAGAAQPIVVDRDYVEFVELTSDQIAKLSPIEKENYLEAKAEHDKLKKYKGLGVSGNARVDIG